MDGVLKSCRWRMMVSQSTFHRTEVPDTFSFRDRHIMKAWTQRPLEGRAFDIGLPF